MSTAEVAHRKVTSNPIATAVLRLGAGLVIHRPKRVLARHRVHGNGTGVGAAAAVDDSTKEGDPMVWAKLAAVATAFVHTAVRDKPAPDRLTQTWASTQDHLPDGWTLDGLRCASIGLSAKSRSDDWIAVAVGPSGEARSHRAADAESVLEGLMGEFESD